MPKPKAQDFIDAVRWNYDNSDVDNQTIREDIQRSDDYYFGRLPGAAATGRSSATSLDCQAMCTAVTADITQGFTSDIPAAFEPMSDQDESAAELETYAVSDVIEQEGGYQLYSAAIDSCLRYGVALAKVWVDERVEVEAQQVPDDDDVIAAIIAQAPDDIEVEVGRRNNGTATLEIRRVVVKPMIRPVDISLARFPKDHQRPDFTGMRYFSVNHLQRRAELIAEFPDKRKVIMDAPATEGHRIWDEATRSKFQDSERSVLQAHQRENDTVESIEAYQEMTVSPGVTQMYRVMVIRDSWELLDAQPWNGPLPFAMGTAFPQPHRVVGVSLVNKLVDIQERSSNAARQLEDNLEGGNLPHTSGYKIELQDRMQGRANGHIRLKGPDSVYQVHAPPDMTSNSLSYLQWLQGQRAERGGAALDLASSEGQLIDSQVGAVAAQDVLGHQETLSAYIARNIGETFVRSLWLTVHNQLRRNYPGQLMVRSRDQAIPVTPAEWPPRDRLSLKAGMANMERRKKTAMLSQVIQMATQFMGGGLPLVDLQALHNIMMDWGHSADLDGIARYLVDPQSERGQAMQQQQAQQAQEQQQLQAFQIQLEQQKEQLDKYKHDTELEFKYWKEKLEASVELETKEAELVTNATTQLAAANAPSAQGSDGNRANGAGEG